MKQPSDTAARPDLARDEPTPTPEAVPSGWRGIESAPRDGTEVFLGGFSPRGKWLVAMCAWETRCEPAIDDDDHQETGWGWPWFQVDPTHWLPLPLPPSLKAEK